jgi:hypothetical protein
VVRTAVGPGAVGAAHRGPGSSAWPCSAPHRTGPGLGLSATAGPGSSAWPRSAPPWAGRRSASAPAGRARRAGRAPRRRGPGGGRGSAPRAGLGHGGRPSSWPRTGSAPAGSATIVDRAPVGDRGGRGRAVSPSAASLRAAAAGVASPLGASPRAARREPGQPARALTSYRAGQRGAHSEAPRPPSRAVGALSSVRRVPAPRSAVSALPLSPARSPAAPARPRAGGRA